MLPHAPQVEIVGVAAVAAKLRLGEKNYVLDQSRLLTLAFMWLFWLPPTAILKIYQGRLLSGSESKWQDLEGTLKKRRITAKLQTLYNKERISLHPRY